MTETPEAEILNEMQNLTVNAIIPSSNKTLHCGRSFK